MVDQGKLRRLHELNAEIMERWQSGEWPHLTIAPAICGPCPDAEVMVVGVVRGAMASPDIVVPRLQEVFAEYGIERVHVTCLLKAGAPGYRPSEPEIEAFIPYFREELVIVAPRIIVPLGAEAGDIITRHVQPRIPIFLVKEPSPEFLTNTDERFRREVWSLARFLGKVGYRR